MGGDYPPYVSLTVDTSSDNFSATNAVLVYPEPKWHSWWHFESKDCTAGDFTIEVSISSLKCHNRIGILEGN